MSKKNKSSKSGGKNKQNKLTWMVKEVFQKDTRKVFNYKQISARLNITDPKLKRAVTAALHELRDKGFIQEVQPAGSGLSRLVAMWWE